jgi:hypothetical protein
VRIKNAHDEMVHSETAIETWMLRRGAARRVIRGPYRYVAGSGTPPSKPMPFVYGLELPALQPPATDSWLSAKYARKTRRLADPKARSSAQCPARDQKDRALPQIAVHAPSPTRRNPRLPLRMTTSAPATLEVASAAARALR